MKKDRHSGRIRGIAAFGSYSVLRWALAAALASTLLFILGSKQAGIASALSLNGRWLMVAGHLSAAFGNSVLLGAPYVRSTRRNPKPDGPTLPPPWSWPTT